MQAFGLVTMEIMPMRITENVYLQTTIYEDEIITAFGQMPFFRQVCDRNQTLKDLLKEREYGDFDVPMK